MKLTDLFITKGEFLYNKIIDELKLRNLIVSNTKLHTNLAYIILRTPEDFLTVRSIFDKRPYGREFILEPQKFKDDYIIVRYLDF